MASLFWAAVLDILSLVYLLRSLIGTDWNDLHVSAVIRIIMLSVLFVSGLMTLVLIYLLISRPVSRMGVVWWVRLEMVFRVVVSVVILILWLSEHNFASISWNQNRLAFVQSIVLATLACILFFLSIWRRGRGGGTPRLYLLPTSQRVLLLAIILTFIPLMVGAAGMHWLERWQFSDAWNFVNMTALTIGYGDIVPVTVGGRVFLVIFGNVMIGFVALLIGVLQYNFRVNLSSAKTFLVVFLAFWAFGSGVFAWLQGWTVLQGVYFTWVTMTTVGYGDLTPTTPLAWEFWFFFIYISCCMLAFFIGLLSETLKKYLHVNLKGQVGLPAVPPAPAVSPSNTVVVSVPSA